MLGTVKFYQEEKGFGFVIPDDGSEDIFLHKSQLQSSGIKSIVKDHRVSFDVGSGKNSQGKMAVNVQLLERS